MGECISMENVLGKMANVWIYLYEDRPENTTYDTTGSQGHETAKRACENNADCCHYPTFTNWRLNSENFIFERDEQKKLYEPVHSG